MKMAVLMDPVEHLKPAKDTTLAIIRRAEAMGWAVSVFTLADLYTRQGEPGALMSSLVFAKDGAVHAQPADEVPLREFNVILMRKDPPFDMEYIYATYTLDLAEKAGVFVVNRPQSLRDANEKYVTQHFASWCPETLTTRSMSRLRAFHAQYRDVIFKPLEGMGGRSVFRADPSGNNLGVILETLTHGETVTVMAQRYIPDIATSGDKRILMIDGEPVPFALARIPAPGDMRGNLAAGARGEVVPITERDRAICEGIGPELRARGLYFVGIDVIGDYLTEINVTSPTCLVEIASATGLDIAGSFLVKLEALVLGVLSPNGF